MDLYFPDNEMWDNVNCIQLGKFELDGEKYDLGVYINPVHTNFVSHAIVYGNKPSDYLSGYLSLPIDNIVCKENIKRWNQYLKNKENVR